MGLENVLLTGKIAVFSMNSVNFSTQIITVKNVITGEIQTKVLDENGIAVFILKGQELYSVYSPNWNVGIELSYGEVRQIVDGKIDGRGYFANYSVEVYTKNCSLSSSGYQQYGDCSLADILGYKDLVLWKTLFPFPNGGSQNQAGQGVGIGTSYTPSTGAFRFSAHQLPISSGRFYVIRF